VNKWSWDKSHIVLLVGFLGGMAAVSYDRLSASGTPMTTTTIVSLGGTLLFGLMNFFNSPPSNLVGALLSGENSASGVDSGAKGDKK